ncbi:MAG: TrbC/VirB2 family protein [Candidatus Tectimicrobiota bacterium]
MRHAGWRIMGGLSGLIAPAQAWAAGAGGGMPWEQPLQQVLASVSGPVAQTLGVLAIIIFGLGMALSDGGGLRTGLGILFGLAIAYSASTFFLTFFGFAGGAVF